MTALLLALSLVFADVAHAGDAADAPVATADTVCALDVFGHRARVVLTDRELEVDGEPVFAYTDSGELAIHIHRMNPDTDRRHFWHEVTHLAATLVPGKRKKWREEDMAMFVELVVPYVLERNPWVVDWKTEPGCPEEWGPSGGSVWESNPPRTG